MSRSLGPPPPHVTDIGKNFITLKVPEHRGWDDARRLGAKYRLLPPQFGIPYRTREELVAHLAGLRDAGFAFLHVPHGWPPAAVMEELIEQALISPGFLNITWVGPGEWRTQKNETRPILRPFDLAAPPSLK